MYDNDARGAATVGASTNAQFEKELAAQRAGGAISSGRLYPPQTSRSEPESAVERAPTIVEAMIRELEQVCSLLSETVERQEKFRERIFGPTPADPNNKANQPIISGSFGLVEERLKWLQALASRAFNNACELNRIG